eukprot:TRINITY_DN31145_c0_g1_i1.p1 TRINITY_DN31145_c0_g1~~TRINITY_DN31145_c0_g1_i1.p1  ORF type:complete len:576 (+),score=95.76 TRINITY_DN31145_c0_g1_i1:87-1814(+)
MARLTFDCDHPEQDEPAEEPLRAQIPQPWAHLQLQDSDVLSARHQELLSRLDHQNELLGQVLHACRLKPPKSQTKDRPAHPASHGEVNGRATNVSVGPEAPRRSTLTPKLFPSFTAADVALREGARKVDAETAKEAKASEARSGMNEFTTRRTSTLTGWVQPIRVARNIVARPAFEFFFGAAIISNAMLIGVELQLSLSNPEGESMFRPVRICYTAMFTIEFVFRLTAAGRKFFYSGDWMWNWLDSIIVLSSLVEGFVEAISTTGQEPQGNISAVTNLRTFRIVRVTRVVRVLKVARIMRFVMALRTLTQSIAYTLKSLIWALVLLALITYVFGVLFAQAVRDHIETAGDDMSTMADGYRVVYFDSLPNTMLTLFMSIAGGVSWEQPLAVLREISELWLFAFLFYISFTYFAVLNVVTGVFCQSAIDSAQSDHDAVLQTILNNKQANVEKLQALFSEIDKDNNGIITYSMFEEKVNDSAVQTYFESLEIDVWDAWTFFKLLDDDGGGGIEAEEFLMGCLRLRGSARAVDMAKLCHDHAWHVKNQGRFWGFMEVELAKLQSQILQLSQRQEQLGIE